MDISKLFSHPARVVYFNHASSSPLAVPVRERMKALVDELEFGDLPWKFWSAELREFRLQAARLLGVEPGEIGFIPNTSTGLLVALYSIPWEAKDNIVIITDAFPANTVVWERNLPNVEKRRVRSEPYDGLEQRLMQAVDENTKAMAVDWVDFFTGYRLDLKMLGDFCRKRGIFLVVDGIQGCGAVKLDLSKLHVDFFAAHSAKWMLGPVGAGILYVNERTLERLRPAFGGWMSLDWKDFNIFDPLPPLKQGAGRFEPGSKPGVPLVGFVENLKILNQVGTAEIERRILALRRLLLEGLERMEAEIISPTSEEHASGILTFRLKGRDSQALYDHLSAERIVVSLRKHAIRLSPHFYNTTDEAMRVLDSVRRFADL